MAIPLVPKQVVSFEELLMSQVVVQEALTRLLVERGIFTKQEFLEMVSLVDKEMKGREKEQG
jgi:chromosome condensin MukBEF MukE localization factor